MIFHIYDTETTSSAVAHLKITALNASSVKAGKSDGTDTYWTISCDGCIEKNTSLGLVGGFASYLHNQLQYKNLKRNGY
jgi:hypothetical protein